MSLLFQNLVSGIAAGSVYALLAIGLVLIYRSSSVVNFAHGSLAMIAAYWAYALMGWGVPTAAAVMITVVLASALGACVYGGVVRPMRARQGHAHGVIVVTLALYLVLEGIAASVWGAEPKPFSLARERSVSAFGFHMSEHDVTIIVVSIAISVGLAWAAKKTVLGLAVRAVRDNALGAELIGLRVDRIHAVVWSLATALAAVSGLLLVPRLLLEPSMMFMPTLKAFAAAVIGGMGSLPGAFIGGLGLGVLETLVGAYVSTEYQPMIAFLVLLLMIGRRPGGLFGRTEAIRA